MSRRGHRLFWPIFAAGLFLANVGVIALVVYIAITKADPVEGPPAAGESEHTQTEHDE